MKILHEREMKSIGNGYRMLDNSIYEEMEYQTTTVIKHGDTAYVVINKIGKDCYEKIKADDQVEIHGLVDHVLKDLYNLQGVLIIGPYDYIVQPAAISELVE